jgi:pyruvate,water dikinase
MKALLREKYFLFQELLNTNNEVLTLMAELSEKLSGEYLFDIQSIPSVEILLSLIFYY